jgi:hypothetical protein
LSDGPGAAYAGSAWGPAGPLGGDTLADALADVLREQALRDGVTLAW